MVLQDLRHAEATEADAEHTRALVRDLSELRHNYCVVSKLAPV
jgi:hypothetical protein